MSWYLEEGAEADVVVSSRVRLARNLSDTKFPWRLNDDEARQVHTRVRDAFFQVADDFGRKSLDLPLDSLDESNKLALSERRLISRNMLKDDLPRYLLLFEDESAGLLVNEEDHLRIQSMRPGFALEEALTEADRISEALGKFLPFAYDERLAYLTTCPTNTGTGLRISVMLHLPFLLRKNLLTPLSESLSKAGYTLRGAAGEGSSVSCDMVQISNQVTLGFQEEEIVKGLSQLAKELVGQERRYRAAAFETHELDLEDEVHRAFGLLSSARKITFNEAMCALSSVRLGIALGILKQVDYSVWQKLFIESGSGCLQLQAGKELTTTEIDQQRADFIRNVLNNINNQGV